MCEIRAENYNRQIRRLKPEDKTERGHDVL